MTPRETLVVDLDGTLFHGDMLFESLCSAVSSDWRCLPRSLVALLSGRASLKRYLAAASNVDVSTLRYNQEVVRFAHHWRSSGGRVVLVTASDHALAEKVSAHLGIFDETHGSNGKLNLKGKEKAKFLVDRFGSKGFAYVGDSRADMPVWGCASTAITVNASVALRRHVDQASECSEHLGRDTKSLVPYVNALRPHQWLKNLLVLSPMLASHRIEWEIFIPSTIAFFAFSFIASSVYVFNDLLDLAADRLHPRKKTRPFASSRAAIPYGVLLALMMLVMGGILALSLSPALGVVMLVYFLLTTAYSFSLKRIIVLDITMLAGLYTLRIIAGGVATGIALSVWFLAFSVFFFLSLAAVKRQAELVESSSRGKQLIGGRGYLSSDLPIISMIAIAAGYVAVLVLVLYVNSPAVVQLYSYPEALWGVCAVLLYWITQAVMMAHRGLMHDDPVVYAVKDRASQACIVLAAGFVVFGALV